MPAARILRSGKKGVLSRTNVRAELPLRLLYDALLAFRLLADIHPALGSGGCFQLLQGQLDGGVTVTPPVQDSLIFRSASRFTASGRENLASFRRLPRISTL